MPIPTLKAILPYFFVAIVAVGLFAGGIWVGMNFTSTILSRELALDHLVKSIGIRATLRYLDENEIDEAHHQLTLEGDGYVMSLDELSAFVSKDTAKSICNHLKAIAKQRNSFPEKYPKPNSEPWISIDQKVQSILKEPRACKVS